MRSPLLALHLLEVCRCLTIEGRVGRHLGHQERLIAQQAHALCHGDLAAVDALHEVDDRLMGGLSLRVGQQRSPVRLARRSKPCWRNATACGSV